MYTLMVAPHKFTTQEFQAVLQIRDAQDGCRLPHAWCCHFSGIWASTLRAVGSFAILAFANLCEGGKGDEARSSGGLVSSRAVSTRPSDTETEEQGSSKGTIGVSWPRGKAWHEGGMKNKWLRRGGSQGIAYEDAGKLQQFPHRDGKGKEGAETARTPSASGTP